jgi:hypothetical protein
MPNFPHFIADLVDDNNIPLDALDRLLTLQRLNPAICRASGADRWISPIVRRVDLELGPRSSPQRRRRVAS